MPVFIQETDLTCPPAKVWEFLIRPANLVAISPPELNVQLAEGPEVLHLAARVTVVGQRWGLTQRMVSEVTRWEPGFLFVDEHRESPLRKWIHTHRLEGTATGTRLTDQIDFEPPGGMLGFMVTARKVLQELEAMFEYRTRRLKELLEEAA